MTIPVRTLGRSGVTVGAVELRSADIARLDELTAVGGRATSEGWIYRETPPAS